MAKEAAPRLDDGFGDDNIWRIYHGRQALIAGWDAQGVLPRRVFEAASYFADGLTAEETAEMMKTKPDETAECLRQAHDGLGIVATHQLAGFFPMDPEYGAVGDKKLGDLLESPETLGVLETMSVGRPVVEAESHIEVVEGIWTDIEGDVMAVRVANAIRGRYVQALRANPTTLKDEQVRDLTLPVLARLEPRIEREFFNS